MEEKEILSMDDIEETTYPAGEGVNTVGETKPTTQETLFSEDEDLEPESILVIYDKKNLLDEQETFTINAVGKNQWGKPVLKCVPSGMTEEHTLNISKTLFNLLIEKLGTKPKAWKGKKIVLEGKSFKQEIDNREVDGVQIELVKVL